MDIQNGLLSSADYCPSAHHNDRPATAEINMIVIHNISLPPGQFGTGCVKAFFCDALDTSIDPAFESLKDLKVSSHLFIERTGQVIQFVPFHLRAWHAGVSEWQGESNCNDFSIGIELEGTDHIPFTDAQYKALNPILKILRKHYPAITPDRILGHSDIAPNRKTDPGPAFDWTGVKNEIK